MILILDILFRFRVTEDLSVVEKCGCVDMHLRSRYFLVSSLFSLLLSHADLCFSSVFVLANKWFQGK
jgi:hypothetical protein